MHPRFLRLVPSALLLLALLAAGLALSRPAASVTAQETGLLVHSPLLLFPLLGATAWHLVLGR